MNRRSALINAEKGHFVNTTTVLVLQLVFTISLVSCKTPKMSEVTQERDLIEQTSNEHETSQIDDTTTIRHTIINDTTLETKIVRKTIIQNEKAAQSLQEDTHEASREIHDSLTPAIINKLLKGFAVACIGIAVLVAGVFIATLIVLLKARR